MKASYELLLAVLLACACSLIINSTLLATASFSILSMVCLVSSALVVLALCCKPIIEKCAPSQLLFYLLIGTAFLGAGAFSFSVGPISLFPYRIVLIIFLPVFLYFLWFHKETPSLQHTPVWPVLSFHIGWIVYGLFSLSWAPSFSAGVMELVFLTLGVSFIFFMIVMLRDLSHFLHVYYIWLFVFAGLLLLGLWNHVTGLHLPISRLHTAPLAQQRIPTAVFVNENDYASFISLSFFLLLAFVHHTKRSFLRYVGVLFLLLSLYIIQLTASRANLLAIVLGGFAWFVVMTSAKLKKRLLLAGCCGLGLFALLVPGRFLALFKPLQEVVVKMMLASTTAEDSVNIRLALLKNGVHYVLSSFGFGVGAGNSKYYLAHEALFPTNHIINLHNWWMDLLVNYGVLIFIGYLLVYVWIIRQLIAMLPYMNTTAERMLCEGLFGAMIAFSLSCISPSSQISLHSLWILFGLGISYINFQKVKRNETLYRHYKLRESTCHATTVTTDR
ncbi:TuaE [Fictibacillus macauensis ZFHKF-1]|uniref:TuaE n=1 Tax=Fictibacillus macauensis ZFHKF-1 TaxID=1196324 RepID=I8UJB1_9BACL|nr:O-antigen ligase family protein [Fictibacillus macauensis]EIT86928.1 TuaE [Fictibacillus macauensis ZFHKF-1]